MKPERMKEMRELVAIHMRESPSAARLLEEALNCIDHLRSAEGSAVREARAEAAECRTRAGDAEERCSRALEASRRAYAQGRRDGRRALLGPDAEDMEDR